MLPKSVWVPPLGSSPWFLLLGSPLGLTYDKNAVEFCPAASVEFCPAAAVAFCPAASKVVMITDSVLPDRMDNLLAFGGVLQIELNKFTRRITRQGFSRTWTFLPRVRCRRQREHILARDGRHLKAYAGEILTLLESMVPSGRLLQECQCLEHAKRAIDMLTYHKVSAVDFLEDELLQHHVLFAKLYADCI